MSKYHTKCTETDVPPKKRIKPPPPPEPPEEDETGLLASIGPNVPCCCAVTSRAIRGDLPKILGMSDRRAAINEQVYNPDIEINDPSGSTSKDPKRK